MKKTFTINLSSIVFHIDEDAYEKLKNYLQMLTRHFGTGSEGREILQDIESRVAELFTGKKKEEGKDVVSCAWVDEVIARLGKPEDFMEEGEPAQTFGDNRARTRRRLYRDPFDRVLGGVCSGIAAFFNIDTLLVRILFFITIWVTASVTLWVYLVLWIAVPKAVTTSQRLEMRGEDATVSNIEKKIKEEIKDVKDSYNKFKGSDTYKNGKTNLSRFGDTLYNIIMVIARIAIVAIGFLCVIIGFFGAISLLVAFFLGHSLLNLLPWILGNDLTLFEVSEFFLSPALSILVKASILLLGLIPLLLLLFIGLKLVFRFRSNNKIIVGSALLTWSVSLLLMVVVVLSQVSQFNTHATTSRTNVIDCDRCTTLYLRLANDGYDVSTSIHMPYFIDKRLQVASEKDGSILIGKPRLHIEKSDSEDFVLVQRRKARGRNGLVAAANAEDIFFRFTSTDSTLRLDPFFRIGTIKRWLDQELDLVLKVPEGKAVWIGEEMSGILHRADNVENKKVRDMAGHTWEMTTQGLRLK